MQTTEKTPTFTGYENTKIYNSYYGWTGETKVKINGHCWFITTSKNSNGIIKTHCHIVQDEGNGSISFMVFETKAANEEFYLNVLPKGTKATQGIIKDAHYKALAEFDAKKEAGELPNKSEQYEVKIGQVLFTDWVSGETDRRAVYKIDGNKYHCVLLDGSDTKIDDHIRPISKKFGIGVYYEENDCITEDQVNDLLIDANKAIEARSQARQKATIEAAEYRKTAIEAGAKILPALPAGATHIILGELQKNESDIMTDYFSSSTEETIYLSFSSHDRDLFNEMRKAAENSEFTSHLGTDKGVFSVYVINNQDHKDGRNYINCGSTYHKHDIEKEFTTLKDAQDYVNSLPELDPVQFAGQPEPFTFSYHIGETSIENREKYTGGSGYYLGCNKYSGWQVRKGTIPTDQDQRQNFLEKLQIAIHEGRYFIPAGEVKENAPAIQVDKFEKQDVPAGIIQIIDYSDKAIAVIGEDTRNIKDKLKELGGKFNFRLSCGPGWIFPKTKLATIQAALQA